MTKITVMIVDDEETVVDLIKMILGDEDKYKIYSYTNPSEALLEFSKNNPELVIADVRMSKITGIEMCLRMREINPEIKVIIFSGDYLKIQEIIEDCKKNGFNYFLEKPFSMAFLKDKLRQVLEN